MQQKNFVSLCNKILVAFLLAISITACKSGNKTNKDETIQDFVAEDEIFNDIDKAKKIFYSLPSPLETAMIIKSAGAEYDQELLNSLDNTEKYLNNRSMALNLGIYTTDLSFASLFDQTQTSINYMEASKKMAEGLDITDAIDEETMNRLKDNLNNREVVMDIISETFLNSSAYLKENERQDVASIVLVGGWVEGLYIATELVGDKSIKDNKLADRILEQKLSFNIVQRLLDDNKSKADGKPNVDIVNLINEMNELKTAFDKVTVTTTEPSVVENKETGVSDIKSKTTVSVSPEDFKMLQASIRKLRTSFIQ